MALGKTGICNLALGHVGNGTQIADIISEQSSEANICRLFFSHALEDTLRDFNWPAVRTYITLELVTENPTTEWLYAYQYPNNVISMRRILSGIRPDSFNSRVPYEYAQSDTTGSAKKLIYTNCQSAVAEFTGQLNNLALLDTDVEMAVSFRLAFYIAPQVTRADPFKMGDRAKRVYEEMAGRAIATAMNSENQGPPQDTDSILARNEGIGMPRRGPYR